MSVAFPLLLLSIGLAMDAVAASVAQGAACRVNGAGAIKIGAAFGVAQAAMPMVGWTLGLAFAPIVESVDHWIALILLSFLGMRMVREGLSAEEDRPSKRLVGWALAAAAIATSIDAAAAGVTLPLLSVPLFVACATIGLTTAVLSYAGVYLGALAGARIGKAAEIGGGVILVGLGVKIFVEHQFFG